MNLTLLLALIGFSVVYVVCTVVLAYVIIKDLRMHGRY